MARLPLGVSGMLLARLPRAVGVLSAVNLVVYNDNLLQHADLDRLLLPRALRERAGWTEAAQLERMADEAVDELRRLRSEHAADHGRLSEAVVALDEWLRTSDPEHLDDPDFPAERKQAIVQVLHRFNQGVLAYRRFFSVLAPLLRSAAAGRRGPVRVLELASGSGEFAFALAELAAKSGIAVEVTGSDYVAEHVAAARRKADARGVAVRFIELDAFDQSGLEPGSYDIVFMAQSLHHFTPGQLALVMARSARTAAVGFVGIDGRRSLALFGIVPMAGVLLRSRDYIHDSLITLRKFYTESELELVARIAVPDGFVSVRPELPGYSVVTVCG